MSIDLFSPAVSLSKTKLGWCTTKIAERKVRGELAKAGEASVAMVVPEGLSLREAAKRVSTAKRTCEHIITIQHILHNNEDLRGVMGVRVMGVGL